MSLSAYTCGISPEVISLLVSGINQVYGEGVTSFEEVPVDSLRVNSRLMSARSDIVLYAVSSDLVDSVDPNMKGTTAYLEYSTPESLQAFFAELGITLDISSLSPSTPARPNEVLSSSDSYDPTLLALLSAQEKIKTLETFISETSLEVALQASKADSNLSNEEVDKYTAQIAELHRRLGDMESLNRSYKSQVDDYKNQVNLLEVRLSKRDVSEDPSESDAQLLVLRHELKTLNSSIFTKLSRHIVPDSLIGDSLPLSHFDRERFKVVFPGADGSIKASYEVLRRLSGELSVNSPVAIIDFNMESFADYTLSIPEFQSASDWLFNGSEPVFSDTRNPAVRVLSPGLGYFNDLTLLRVPWGDRIAQLQDQGYYVIVMAGTLNNAVARVIYNTFAVVTQPIVVVEGKMTSLRNLILHVPGLTPVPRVFVKNINPAASGLYQYLVQTCNTSTLSDTPLLGGE